MVSKSDHSMQDVCSCLKWVKKSTKRTLQVNLGMNLRIKIPKKQEKKQFITHSCSPLDGDVLDPGVSPDDMV